MRTPIKETPIVESRTIAMCPNGCKAESMQSTFQYPGHEYICHECKGLFGMFDVETKTQHRYSTEWITDLGEQEDTNK